MLTSTDATAGDFTAGLSATVATLSFFAGLSDVTAGFLAEARTAVESVFTDAFVVVLTVAGLTPAFTVALAGLAVEEAVLVAVFETGLATLEATAPVLTFAGLAGFFAITFAVFVATAFVTVFVVFVCALALTMSIPTKRTIRNPENPVFYQNMARLSGYAACAPPILYCVADSISGCGQFPEFFSLFISHCIQ